MPHPTPDHPADLTNLANLTDGSRPLDSPSDAALPLVIRAADAVAFSSGLASAIAGSLSLVASRVLDAPDIGSWAFLSASGTFIIYNLDRLRDVDRDRTISPLRTAFVLRNRTPLYAAVGLASIGFAASWLTAPPSIMLLCAAIGLVGLLHRRMKKVASLKASYVSLAWVAACVGMPWLASGRESSGPWVAGILLASLAANLIVSNLREDQGEGIGRGPARSNSRAALWIARALALLGIGITLAAPTPLRALVWIPVCEGLALVYFRSTERYGQIVVDGGLFLGALATLIHLG